MDVLLWLAPAGGAMVLAMAWAAWLGHRERVRAADDGRRSPAEDAAARARLGKALARRRPRRSHHREPQRVERATGVAVRRTAPARPVEPGAKLTR